jgi:hypothetical protein
MIVVNGAIGGALLDTWTMTAGKVFFNTLDGIP